MKRATVIGLTAAAGAAAAMTLLIEHTTRAATTQPPAANESSCQDDDGDGYGLGCRAGKDCNDWDATVHPGRPEVCNYRDDDCNALVDDVSGCAVPDVDSTLVSVPAGRFLMGSNVAAEDERPEHVVEVSAFRIDRVEVTNRRYQTCVDAGDCSPPALLSSNLRKEYYANPQFADYPAIFVDWHQADAYCRQAGGRLPTEAEWEKTARGVDLNHRTYPWGEAPPDCSRANRGGAQSCVGDTDRVGRRPDGKSPYGALDMAGNVWEWVADWYEPSYYEASPDRNPGGPDQGRLKVMRGGCWVSGSDTLRVSCRKAELPSTWAYNVGFRCAYPEGK